MKEIERRAAGTLEVRNEEGQPQRLAGYAAVFNQETVIGAYFREVIIPGAFDRAIGEKQDVVAWFQHGDEPLPLGRTSSGTLRLNVDDRGLKYEVDLPDTQFGRDLATSVARRDISQSSFAFLPTSEKWDEAKSSDQLPLRSILDVDLFDVSPVVFAAYKGTSVGVRDAADVLKRHLDSRQEQMPPSEAELETPVENHEASILRIQVARRRH
jgi:hypothetical protein